VTLLDRCHSANAVSSFAAGDRARLLFGAAGGATAIWLERAAVVGFGFAITVCLFEGRTGFQLTVRDALPML